MGCILSKNAIEPLIPSMSSPVEAAMEPEHPFRAAPPIPYDLQYAMKLSEDIATAGLWRAEQRSKIELLSRHCQELGQCLWERMDETV